MSGLHSFEEVKQRTNERKRVYTRLTKQPLRQFVAEPYLTPFHHINLVMQELQASPVAIDEASAVVEEIMCRYNPMTSQSANTLGSQSSLEKNSQNAHMRESRRTESILSASQVSMSQYEGQTKRVQPRNALLADALEILCEHRNLIFERHNIKNRSDFSSLKIIPGETVLLYISKCELYFVSLFALSASAARQLEPLFRRENRKNSSERSLMQVTCCFPHPTQWRCVAVQKIYSLSTQQCVLVSISRNPRVALNAGCKLSTLNSSAFKEWEDGNAGVKSRKRSRFDDSSSEEQIMEENIVHRTSRSNREISGERVSPLSVNSEFGLHPSSLSGDSVALNGHDFVYPRTPYKNESIFLRENSTFDDPFFRLPRGFTVPLRSRGWCNTVFLMCTGRLRHKSKLVEDARKAAEDDEMNKDEYFLL